tara:strand:+ start:25894 stop:26451 length:558 start_codon:yes stop_codon:yes gene_type:complete
MKRILIFAFLITFQFLNAQIDKTDLTQLEKLVYEFDIVLKKYYPKVENNSAYKNYIDDLLQRKVNPNIINEKNSFILMKKFTKSSTFKKIWILNPKKNKKKFVINYNGEFYSYITENCKNKDLKQSLLEFKKLNTNESMPFEPSPYIILGAFTGYLKENDYNLKNTKSAIAIMFYYDIMSEHKIK